MYGCKCPDSCLVCKVDILMFHRPEFDNVHGYWLFKELAIVVDGKEHDCLDDFLQSAKPKPFDSETWKQMQDAIMMKGLRAKFCSNILLRQFLISTFPHQLLSLKKDVYWAFDPATGCGKNFLAEMLMQLRNEFVEEDAAAATKIEEDAAAAVKVEEDAAAAAKVEEDAAAAAKVEEDATAAAAKVEEDAAAAAKVQEDAAAAAEVEEDAAAAAKGDGKDKQRLSTANFRLPSTSQDVIPFGKPQHNAAVAARIHQSTEAAKAVKQSAREAECLEQTLKRPDWRCFMLNASKQIDLAIATQVAKGKHGDEQKVCTRKSQWVMNASDGLNGLIKAKFPQMHELDAGRQKDLILMSAKECCETLELSHQTEFYGMAIQRLLRKQAKSETGRKKENLALALAVVAGTLAGDRTLALAVVAGTLAERKLQALAVVAVYLQGSKEVSSCYVSTVIFTLAKGLPLRCVPELLEQWKDIVGDDSNLRRKCLGDSC